MNLSDTGIMFRNDYMSNVTSAIIRCYFDKKGTFLDYSGGYGVFTRLMRDIGYNFLWHDLFTQNVLARGFEYDKRTAPNLELVTNFEAFEHFLHPIEDIEKILKLSDNILLTTSLAKIPAPAPQDWWYYGLEHGQHISLYRKETLRFIAKKYNLNLYSHRTVHLLTKKKLFLPLFIAIVRYPAFLNFFCKIGMKPLHHTDMMKLKNHK
jgi:hypothetical protein